MRRGGHRSLALALGLVLTLVPAGVAAAADFAMPNSANPSTEFSVTPQLTAAEAPLAEAVHFRFSDTDVRDATAPFTAALVYPGYATTGNKTVTMQVELSAGDDLFVTKTIRINAVPDAAFTRNVTTPNVGQVVRFDATPSTDDQETDPNAPVALPNSAYAWDFDNNGSFETTGLVVQRSFTTPGDKIVRLRVTDSGGRTDVAQATVHVNRPPVAALIFSPRTPQIGDNVEFNSVSDDPDNPIALEEWDLDGDGQYDDARGSTVIRAFATSGNHTVRLRVRDTLGRIDTVAVVFAVRAADVPPPVRIRPWPRIRLVGFAGVRRVRLDLLTVRTIKGATVKVRCSGRGCPRRKAVSTRARGTLVRLRWLERRLPTGTRLFVAITYPNKIGRYERILLRPKHRPRRHMSCLYPGEPKARAC
jgi:PKD repeat protein